jgi:AcrR family transcriptional regulator
MNPEHTMKDSGPTPNGPRWRRRKHARPSEILSAALEVFMERGFEDARLEEIARRAGCTKGTIFLYYPGKVELFKAAVREAMIPMLEAAERAFETHTGTMREALETLLRKRWVTLTSSPAAGLPAMLISDGHRFPDLIVFFHEEIWRRTHAHYTRILETGVARGEFRPMDCTQVARAAMAPLVMANLWQRSFDPVLKDQVVSDAFIDNAIEILFRGIAP